MEQRLPSSDRFTRQQLSELTGVEGELLGYWIKEGLLRAAESEGRGKGHYRQFGFEAVHIAAVMRELMRYGAQTAGLKPLAQLLWGVVEQCSQRPDLDEEVCAAAGAMRRARKRLPARSKLPTARPSEHAQCFEEWLGTADIPDLAFEIEPWFDEGAELAFALYHELFTDRIYDGGERPWVFCVVEDDLVAIPQDMAEERADLEHLPSYMTINIPRLIWPIWEKS